MNETTPKTKAAPNEIVKVKLDVIFKKMFTENENHLRELLTGLLSLPEESIQNIDVKNSEILPDEIGGKFVRMDINIEVDDKLINIEMQYSYDSHYKDRALFYWAKLYSGELKSGNEYDKLKHGISINIVNSRLFDCKEYRSCFTVMEKNRLERLSDKCEIHFFELPKISKTANKEDMTELWLQLINAETEEELKMLSETGVAPIQQAVVTVRKMSEDEKIREIARLREKALHDEATALKHAREEGAKQERKKQKAVIAKKDKALAAKDKELADAKAEIARLEAQLAASRK